MSINHDSFDAAILLRYLCLNAGQKDGDGGDDDGHDDDDDDDDGDGDGEKV